MSWFSRIRKHHPGQENAYIVRLTCMSLRPEPMFDINKSMVAHVLGSCHATWVRLTWHPPFHFWHVLSDAGFMSSRWLLLLLLYRHPAPFFHSMAASSEWKVKCLSSVSLLFPLLKFQTSDFQSRSNYTLNLAGCKTSTSAALGSPSNIHSAIR